MRPIVPVLGLSIALLLSPSANAAVITFEATLSGLNENPANPSPGTGDAVVTWDTLTDLMTVEATFSGLIGTTTAAHIHCCVDPPANVGVATTTPSFPGFPLGVTSGSFVQTFNMTLASSYNPAFITAHGATVTQAEADLLAGLLAGRAYFNIHTTVFGGGEIRGFLTEVQQVPEPGTLVLFAGGWGMIMVRGLRRKRVERRG